MKFVTYTGCVTLVLLCRAAHHAVHFLQLSLSTALKASSHVSPRYSSVFPFSQDPIPFLSGSYILDLSSHRPHHVNVFLLYKVTPKCESEAQIVSHQFKVCFANP